MGPDTLSATAARPDLSMAQQAYLQLRERLVMLDITPGEPLNEQALAAELQVGRTPLREAIKRLETEHFLVTFARRGTFATRVDPTALAEISEVRQALEPLAARRAARLADRSGREDLEAIRTALLALDRTSTPRRHMEMDVQVHTTIYALARNSHLESSLTHFLFLAMRIWSAAVRRLEDVSSHVAEHVRLIDAVATGDEDLAARLMLEHMEHFEDAIRRVL
ncbi:GntR family transcriptional regulator [Ornithinimicrobium avium]|uniref:GntR family transcriptional regulator n=1 Tax=Ornithinimicrobium avium TaxID=2283195 RepID=UPI0026D62988|nr:GntR family transcriptional regulator [Ornithinimicrobium avium]